MKTIILASASPRRKKLRGEIGLRFKVEPSNYEENTDNVGLGGESPNYCLRRKGLFRLCSVCWSLPADLTLSREGV